MKRDLTEISGRTATTSTTAYELLVDFKRLLLSIQAASAAVIQQKEQLNEINYFPVSDKDTGNNLASTLQGIQEIPFQKYSIAEVLSLVSESVFERASGNSGVIFSIWMTGIETYPLHKTMLTLQDIYSLISQGVDYLSSNMEGIQPGTMVSFLQNFSKLVSKAKEAPDIDEVIHTCLMQTQHENPVLKVHGVVDAGAFGVAIFLRHLFKGLFVKEILNVSEKSYHSYITPYDVDHKNVVEKPVYRYCTQAQIEITDVDFDSQFLNLKNLLEQFGDCDLLVKRNQKVHFHLHTNTPQKLFAHLYEMGRVTQPKIEDILRQYQASHAHAPIALVTDSSADMDKQLMEKYQVHLLPLALSFDNHEALDPYMVEKESFYDKIDRFSVYPKTASPHLKKTYTLLTYLEKYYDKILVITISSKMSASYQSLVSLSKRLSKVFVLDSLTNSGAHGFLVNKAAELIHEKYSFDDVFKKLDAYRKQVSIFVAVNSVSSMVRSGRVAGLKARLLKAGKPKLIITIDSKGKSRVCKTLFHQNDIIECLVQKIAKIYQQKPFKRYCVLHVGDAPLADYVVEKLSRIIQMQPIFVDSVSSVIGVHAGKGAVAIAFDTGD